MVIVSVLLLAALGQSTTVASIATPITQESHPIHSHRVALPLAYHGPAELHEEALALAKAEVARILDEAGIAVEDFSPGLVDATERPRCGFPVRVVIKDASPLEWGLPDNAMGAARGEMPPNSVYLFYPAILRNLGAGNGGAESLSNRALGTSLAYVTVHELVHAFAPNHKHSGWGIMGHQQDKSSLTQAGLTLHRRAADALRSGWQTVRGLLGC